MGGYNFDRQTDVDDYKKILKKDKYAVKEYFLKSAYKKTQQQLFLEKLLKDKDHDKNYKIADVACGGGGLSYHLKNDIFPNAEFHLFDYLDDAIELAKQVNKENDFNYHIDNIYDMKQESNFFDYVFCWQTLSWLDNPKQALSELVRIARPGGKIFASSLFNLDHDVDIYAKVLDHTKESAKDNIFGNYNTYSLYTIKNWLKGMVANFEIIKFEMDIDLMQDNRGLGTYTKKVADSLERVQISGGMLMNWGILIITK